MSEEQTELLRRIADELSRIRALTENSIDRRSRVDHEKGKVVVSYDEGEPGMFKPKVRTRDIESDL